MATVSVVAGVTTLTIDDEPNDDWMKSLPGYKDEIRLHEALAKTLTKQPKPKVVVKLRPSKP